MNRREHEGFDQRVADWLEGDPLQAPPAVLETVLAAFPSIPQRRSGVIPLGWRTTPMSMPIKLGLSAAAVVAVLVAGGLMLNNRPGPNVGAPPTPTLAASPTPTSEPSATTASPSVEPTTTHTSTRYGYSIVLPPDFVANAARTSWPRDTPYSPASPWADRYDGDQQLLSIASQPLADGQTAEAWLEAYITRNDERTGDACGDDSLASWVEAEVGAGRGRRFAGTCADEGGSSFVTEWVIVEDQAAWLFNWQAPTGTDDEAMAQLEEMLETFTYPD